MSKLYEVYVRIPAFIRNACQSAGGHSRRLRERPRQLACAIAMCLASRPIKVSTTIASAAATATLASAIE